MHRCRLEICIFITLTLTLVLGAAGCSGEVGSGVLTYEEFKAGAYQEPDTGVFIINGDEAIDSEQRLQEAYEAYLESAWARDDGYATTEQALLINQVNGADDRWSPTTARSLRYCVSQATFGANHATVVSAVTQAANAWEAAARVDFIHEAWRDNDCTANTPGVIFDVNQVNFNEYDARAFYPNAARPARNLRIDARIWTQGVTPPASLVGLLRHELGHALGFRHEHTRGEANPDPNTGCFEDNFLWRALTPYDVASVMHYRASCNGLATGDYDLTWQDQWGASLIYPFPPCPYYPCP